MVAAMFETAQVVPERAAEAAIRAYCGWHIAPVITETLTRDGNGRSALVLPTRRVKAISAVKIDGVDVTSSVRWSEAGLLEGVRFPKRFRSVEVSLTHGYAPDEVADIAGLLKTLVVRFGSDPRIRSQSVGGASVSYFGSSVALSHLLTADEKAALEPYRITWGC